MEKSFMCKSCGHLWNSVREAINCCSEAEEITIYGCPACGQSYDYTEQADKCCLSDKVTEGYECPSCGEFYMTEDEAGSCCDPECLAVVNQKKAEEKGQQRMFE